MKAFWGSKFKHCSNILAAMLKNGCHDPWGAKYEVAKYPNLFIMYISTSVQNLVLLSQNAQWVSYAAHYKHPLSYCKLNSSNLIGSLAVIMRPYYLPVAGNIGHVILL
jgi:hypothetical protein